MVGSKLNLKLVRDVRFSPWMFGGIVLLLIVGITLFGASYELYLNLEGSYRLSYETLNLADFSVAVQSAPTGVLETLRRIPGVEHVQGRTIQEVEIEQPEVESRKVVGRIISLPDSGEPEVNQVKLIAGSYPERDASREVLLEASFASYHGYEPGDTIRIVIQEDEVEFRIAGIVQSAEYIYVVRGREYPMPSPRTFGVMWMRKSMVDELFGTSGSVNDIGVTMAPGGNRRTAMRLAERILSPYGADDPLPQEDQASVELLRLDLMGLRNLALFFPILFLTISSLSIYNLVSRMVHAQRSQIGFLRAVGFSRYAVALHYVEFALLIGIIGGGIGSLAGHYASIPITMLYTSYIEVPFYDVAPRWGVIIAGFLFATGLTVLAGLFPAVAAARLTPAQAIAVEVPLAGRSPVVERYLPFLRRLSLLARLPLRNFFRNPRRTLSSVAGVASAATLLLVSAGLLDSTRATINFYFEYSIHYDILASYLHPQTEFAMERIERWPGVNRVEPLLTVPAKLVKGEEEQTILIYGVRPGDELLALTTAEGDRVEIERSGLMVAESTARTLDLWEGGRVRLTLPRQTVPEVPEPGAITGVAPGVGPVLRSPSFRERVFTLSRSLLETELDRLVQVSAVTYQPIGNTGYASIEEVRRWYGSALELPPGAITAVAIEADPRYVPAIERELYDLEGIASVEVTRYIEEEIEELMESSNTFFLIMLSFSIALAAVIMFNSTFMNVIERTREIATLRTVGLSIREVAWMITAETLLAFVVGLVLGLPFGTWMADRFVQAYESESFSLRTVIFARTYWLTVTGILITVLLAQLPGILYTRGIELARATKDIG